MTLDLSKRSRSGKFRLVTKFKKEKNNKNREAHSSLGAPGTAPRPLLSPWVLWLIARSPWAVTPVVAFTEPAVCSRRAEPRPPTLRWLLTVVTPGPELIPHADAG